MSDKTSNKSLNCPLCGSLSGFHIANTKEYIRAYTGKIQCSECDLMLQMTSNDVSELRTSLFKAWNTRKPMERILERLDKMKSKPTELVYDVPLINSIIEILNEEGGVE